jgi:hypothetical protein
MSASQFPVLRASSARQATSALARYERHVRRLAATWLDMELYATVSAEMDEIRRFATVVPALAVPCTAVLISHADLIHALWAANQPGAQPCPGEVDRRLEEHLHCIDALARRCVRIGSAASADGQAG